MSDLKDQKAEILKKTMASIEKNHGKGSVMFMNGAAIDVERMPTGFYSLDKILGGGIPKGRVIEIYGPESNGKTTLALQIASEFQKNNEVVAYIDVEHALDPVYSKKIGVNVDEMLISQPDSGEDALDIANELIASGVVGLIVVDSVAALTPRAELEGEMGDSQVGLMARLMSKGLRKLVGITAKTKCTIIFINQIREKVGISYGSNETTPGGRALKFSASVRIDVRKVETLKKGSDSVGMKVRIRTTKNKTAPPFQTAYMESYFGHGFDKIIDMIDYAIDHKIIDKSGSWFSYGDARIGQGKNNVKDFLIGNQKLYNEIKEKCNKCLKKEIGNNKVDGPEEEEN